MIHRRDAEDAETERGAEKDLTISELPPRISLRLGGEFGAKHSTA